MKRHGMYYPFQMIFQHSDHHLSGGERRMEAPPWNRESEDLFNEKELVDPVFSAEASAGVVDFEISGKDTSESANAKRKIESLFCFMRKRNRSQKSVDDMFLNAEFENLMGSPNDLLEEEMSVEDCFCSGSETGLSECSEFDVISEHVLEDMDLIPSKSLSICNFPCPIEDEGTLVHKLSSETQNSILLLSPDDVIRENGVRSLEDEVFSSASALPKEDILRRIINIADPEITFNPDIFENNGDISSAGEVIYGDVVSIPLSLEKMTSNDEQRLGNKDYDPIPISIVRPDGELRVLPETCSLHGIVSCTKEYNVHVDNIGLEISPIPLTKTLEAPSRPWSVCGSLAAGRNLPLMEDSSGACSSMVDKLYVNVNSEDRDAELAQTPSTLYQEDVDGEDEIGFSAVDAMIRKLNLVPDDSELYLNREEWNMSKHPRHTLLGSEHCTRTSTRRAIMFQGAIAVLHCRDSKHFIRKHEVIIGRSSGSLKVDIDLGKDGYGSKISRRQALVKLENHGSFSLKNLGKGHILVNEEKLETGQIANLTPCSSINIRGIVFVLEVNKEAVKQFLENNTRRNSVEDTKFRWCE